MSCPNAFIGHPEVGWKWIPAKLVPERSVRGNMRERQTRIHSISFLEWTRSIISNVYILLACRIPPTSDCRVDASPDVANHCEQMDCITRVHQKPGKQMSCITQRSRNFGSRVTHYLTFQKTLGAEVTHYQTFQKTLGAEVTHYLTFQKLWKPG